MENKIFGDVDAYIAGLLANEDAALQATAASLEANGMPHIAVSATQGKLLQVLAKLCNAKHILELGTLAGYSSIWMARALPEGGKLISIEFDERYAAVARKNIGVAGLSDKIEVRTGKALDVLPQLQQEGAAPFDMVFIDADKPPYPEYFQWAIKLARPGALIIADNVVREGRVLDEGSTDERVVGVRKLNQMLPGFTDVSAIILQMVGAKDHDGMVIAVKN